MISIRDLESALTHLHILRNMGIWLRVLLAVNAILVLLALASNLTLSAAIDDFLYLASLVEPILLGSLLILHLAHRSIMRFGGYRAALFAVVLVPVLLAELVNFLASQIRHKPFDWLAPALWTILVTYVLLYWIHLRWPVSYTHLTLPTIYSV